MEKNHIFYNLEEMGMGTNTKKTLETHFEK